MNQLAYEARRRGLLARVHILRNELSLPEDEYRAMLNKLTGKGSSAMLNMAELDRWVKHLQSIKNRYAPHKKHVMELTAHEAKVWSLWQELADIGEVKNRSMTGLMGYIKNHIERVDHIRWLNEHQINALIEQLKNWVYRAKDEKGLL